MSVLSSRAFVPEIGQSRHRRVLFICPIDPSFGRAGEYIRIRNLLSTIGAFADVTLICPCQGNARFQVSVSRRVSIVSHSTGHTVYDILSEHCSSPIAKYWNQSSRKCDHVRICLSCGLITCIGGIMRPRSAASSRTRRLLSECTTCSPK